MLFAALSPLFRQGLNTLSFLFTRKLLGFLGDLSGACETFGVR